ncbi:hypothetical protein COLO4_16295 [Corchorus olitorius]|uniref:Uncharacterized protein n=1 Tax=Corchorus olitorius TaxID=93759 RepID=A0A1R3JIE2_9ROSI|nr:hypothetical protein COLO4_16295 [Corchorus olitorius]
MAGKAKPKKHKANEIAAKVDVATTKAWNMVYGI